MKKRLRGLQEAFASQKLVRLNRKPIDEYNLNGYIVGLSDKFLLLHLVDGGTLLLNGYTAVRTKDIKGFTFADGFVPRYLQIREMLPVIPTGMDLSNWSSLLASIARSNSLFMIYCEKTEPDVVFVGHIEKLTKKCIALKKINHKAEWIEAEKFKFCDLTRVDFASGYERALEWIADYDTRAEQTP